MEGVCCYVMLGCNVVLCQGVGNVLRTARHTYIQSLYTAYIMISHEYYNRDDCSEPNMQVTGKNKVVLIKRGT
jgi:hypothetical protein